MFEIGKLLLYGIAVYAGLGIYIYFTQSGVIFYPNMPGRELISTPQQIGLDYEDIKFNTADNIQLHGWFIPHPSAQATVLFFHGNAGNISHRLESIKLFHQLALNVFIFDYRGYGISEGRITEEGTYKDAAAAWRYLTETRGINNTDIIVFGRSLGGAIAAWLASQYTPGKLIIESSFSSVPSMAKRLYPYLPVGWLSRFKYNTEHHVKNLQCPLLVIHSREDDIIPFEEGRKIYDAAAQPKQFLQIRGGHNDGFMLSGAAYLNGLRAFIRP